MLELISQNLLCAVLAGLLGLYIGYLLGKESCNAVTAPEAHH